MEDNRVATTILLILVSIPTGIAEIVTKPTVTEAVVGGSTYLNCSTNSRLKISWFRTQFESSQENFVFRNDTFHPSVSDRFQMERNEVNEAYNLVIPSVEKRDAGDYGCQEETGQGSKESAQLIVLDSNPVCEPVLEPHEIIGPNKCKIEPNQLILSCTVKYHGYEAPILEWRRVSDNTLASEGVTHETIYNNRVVYNLTIKGNSDVKDGDSYFCNTSRSAMSNYGCISGKIKIRGTVVDCPPCAADQICKPYIDASICILLIILPVAIFGTVLVMWYLHVYRLKNLKEEGEGAKEETSEPNCHPPPQGAHILYRRDEIINDLEDNDKSNKAKITSLQLENSQLLAKVKDLEDKVKDLEERLEQRLYAKENMVYLNKPVLAHTIELSDKDKGKSEGKKKKSINGTTVLGKELFVVTNLSKEIEVYDSEKFQHQRNMEIREMTDPLDIASSKDANCLYIVDRLSEETESNVMRFDPVGRVYNQWSTGGRTGRLSTYGSNVIVCLVDKQLINEYSPEGMLIVTVRLSPAAKLISPMHAIKVTDARFIVSHGDVKDELHRVCLVDLEGNIKNECTKLEKSIVKSRETMKVPICLMEDSDRSIIVADTDSKRILLLSSMLKCQRKLIDEENGLKDFPVRLCFDDTQSRLFVAVNKRSSGKEAWKGGRVLVYNVKSEFIIYAETEASTNLTTLPE